MEKFKCQIVSWDDIVKWTRDVANKIKDSGFDPDIIVGLTRGGWVPARLMCDYLQKKELFAVKTEHWGITATRTGIARLAQKLGINVEDKKVLVVDDITDTGQSLSLAVKHIRELKPNKLHTATLLHIVHSSIEPDFYSMRVEKEDWTWFVFPWNFHEDMRSLIPKTLYKPKDEHEIFLGLKEQFGINVDVKDIANIVEDLSIKGTVIKKDSKWMVAN